MRKLISASLVLTSALSMGACKTRSFSENASAKSPPTAPSRYDTQYGWWKLDLSDYEAIIEKTHDFERAKTNATNRERNLFILAELEQKYREKEQRLASGPFESLIEHKKREIAKKRPFDWVKLPRPWERFVAPWHALNPDEQDLWNGGNGAFEGEVVGFKVLVLARFARKVNHEFFEESERHNGNGDALMHSLWNALMVKYVGMEAAEKWAMAHETGNLGGGKGLLEDIDASRALEKGTSRTDGQPVEEFMMDENNNIMGRAVGANAVSLSGEELMTDEAMARLLVQQSAEGKLMRIKEIESGNGSKSLKLFPTDASGLRAGVDFSKLGAVMQKTIDAFPLELKGR